jgi:hypothetical protein
MALSPQETEFVYNWQVSILNAARDCDLTLVRCVRMIIRIVMPNSSPPLDLTEHAKQTKISPADKEAVVAWIRLLDEVSREGNRELCLRLQRVCMEVFHSQGYPDAMLHGPWDGASGSNSRGSAGAHEDVLQQQTTAQVVAGPPPALEAPPAGDSACNGGPPPDYFIRNEEGVMVATRLWYGQQTVISHAVWRKMRAMWPVLSRTRNGQPYEEEREPWYCSAETVLKNIGNGSFTVDDLLEYLEECSPTDEQKTFFRQFIAEDGDQMEIMVRLLKSIEKTVAEAV